MPHELHASLCVVLPDGPRELAEAISVATGAWAELLEKLEAHKPTAALAINETRSRPPAAGAKRGPKPRAPVTAPTTLHFAPVEE